MKTDLRTTQGNYECAYSIKEQGFEFIYIQILSGEKILLLENRLAIQGIWLNDFQVIEMVKQFSEVYFLESGKKITDVGNEIFIESYKHRGIGIYNESGILSKQSPDVIRSIKIQ